MGRICGALATYLSLPSSERMARPITGSGGSIGEPNALLKASLLNLMLSRFAM